VLNTTKKQLNLKSGVYYLCTIWNRGAFNVSNGSNETSLKCYYTGQQLILLKHSGPRASKKFSVKVDREFERHWINSSQTLGFNNIDQMATSVIGEKLD